MKSKSKLIKRWGVILEEIRRDIHNLINLYKDPIRNEKCSFNSGLYDEYRNLAMLDYILNNDADSFRKNLRNAIPLTIEVFEKFDRGEPLRLDASPVSMFSFTELFDALASGDITMAIRLANLMGGRPEVEDQYDDEFMLSMGYCLKYATVNNLVELKPWVIRLKDYCYDPKNLMTEFIGYPLVLEALLEHNLEKANKGFEILIEGHKKKCSKYKEPEYGPYFYDSPDADLFVWGIGLANLCRYYGMNVKINDSLIPEELTINCHQSLKSQ